MLDFHDFLYWLHIVCTAFGLVFNGVLLYLIKYHTRPEMRKYRRILYQNCLLEVAYAVISGIAQTKVETYGDVSLITPTGVPSATRSQANLITTIWVFSLYAVIFSVPIQFFYRYLIIVRGTIISRTLYAVMLIPSFIIVSIISGGYYVTLTLTPDCTSEILAMLKSSNEGHNFACVPLILTHPGMLFILTVASLGMTFCLIYVPYINYLVYKNLRNKASMSSSEKSVQRQVSFTLILQVGVICVTSMFPLACLLANMALSTSLPWLSTLASTIFSVLPVVNPILTMFTIRAYKRVLINIVRRVYGKNTLFSVVSVTRVSSTM